MEVGTALPDAPTVVPSWSFSAPLYRVMFYVVRLPMHTVHIFSYTKTATVTFDFWSLLALLTATTIAIYLLIRYRVLTRYSRLPAPEVPKHVGTPFDLHPDTALDDKQDVSDNYPDDFMGVFLSSIKVFGYLDRPVFHELARHLQTRKLKAGEILFGPEDDVRDFYVVVDGVMQVFVKGADEAGKDSEVFQYESDGEDSASVKADGGYVGRDWAGHHLLNEVPRGGTVSSLFGILSVFTEELDEGPRLALPGDGEKLDASESLPAENLLGVPGMRSLAGGMIHAVFPGLRRTESKEETARGVAENESKKEADKLEKIEDADSSKVSEVPGEKVEAGGEDAKGKPTDTLNVGAPPAVQPKLRSIHPNIITRAGTDVTLAVIPAEAFKKVTEKFPNAAAHIVQVILTRFQRVTFMTLYRYLGLSKELLKIEKRVNEVAGHGLPPHFFEPGALDRLRSRMRAKRDRLEVSVTDTDTFRETVREPTITPARNRPTSPRLRRKSRSKHAELDYEADVSDSDVKGGPRIVVQSPRASRSSSSHLLADHEEEDEAQLREAVFECISRIIGMNVAAAGPSAGAPSASSLALFRTPAPLLGSLLSRTGLDSRQSSPSNSKSSIDVDDGGSETSRASTGEKSVSATSLLSDPGPSEIQTLFFERGSTLIREGDRGAGLYFVIDGVLEASMVESTDPNFHSIYPNGGSADEDDDADDSTATHRGQRRSLFLIRPGGLAGYLAAVTGHSSFVTIRAKTDVQVGFMSKAVLDRYIDNHPSILLCLAKRLISQLSPLVLHIDVALEWGQVNAGQVLCRQGTPADSIFIVLNGRLRSIVERQRSSGDSPTFEILAEYGQGESVGELEVLTDASRPGTVHAIRDTEIAVMPKTLFHALALRHPEITIAISRIIAARSRFMIRNAATDSLATDHLVGTGADSGKNNANLKTVAILPVNSLVPIVEFADKLKDSLQLIGASVALLNTAGVMGKLGKHAFSRIGRLKLNSWLADQEESHRLVLYVADGGINSPWTLRCVRQADCILLVGLGDEDPSIGEFERLLIGLKTTARKELVLLHSERACLPGSTAQWLKNRVQMPMRARQMLSQVARKNTLENLRSHLQRFYNPNSRLASHPFKKAPSATLHTGIRSDFARIARRLLSKSIGLVLGGGGARGIAHIGVIRALEEAGIPVDMVGGTSIGSFVGGLYARENDHVSVYGRAKMFSGRMVSKWRQILDLTYPVTALFTGHEFNRGIWKCFRETHIEDCWLSYFAVTTNITWSRMEIHRTGYIWRYVRASMSLAGYLPPLCDNGNMLLDGGYLNNLPADIMRSMGAETIIAVDVGAVDDTSPVNYGDSLSGWWVLLQRWNPFKSSTSLVHKIPQMADIQSRLAYVSSVKQLEDAKRIRGCFYFHPPVNKFGTLEFDQFKEIFEVGYKCGKEMVKKWEKDGVLERRFGVKVGEGGGSRRHTRRASI
ncbi:phosphatidylcholine and lysophosphatidylcholine phospholipase [Borealophlyctis nickersoniae]|nr:phosphatidylcholine and lysophosphatidylcholine phospholipase [Borealophlyctis nickersoniae]